MRSTAVHVEKRNIQMNVVNKHRMLQTILGTLNTILFLVFLLQFFESIYLQIFPDIIEMEQLSESGLSTAEIDYLQALQTHALPGIKMQKPKRKKKQIGKHLLSDTTQDSDDPDGDEAEPISYVLQQAIKAIEHVFRKHNVQFLDNPTTFTESLRYIEWKDDAKLDVEKLQTDFTKVLVSLHQKNIAVCVQQMFNKMKNTQVNNDVFVAMIQTIANAFAKHDLLPSFDHETPDNIRQALIDIFVEFGIMNVQPSHQQIKNWDKTAEEIGTQPDFCHKVRQLSILRPGVSHSYLIDKLYDLLFWGEVSEDLSEVSSIIKRGKGSQVINIMKPYLQQIFEQSKFISEP